MITITKILGYYDGPLQGALVHEHETLFWETHAPWAGPHKAWRLSPGEWETLHAGLDDMDDEAKFQDLLDLLDFIRSRDPHLTFMYDEAEAWDQALKRSGYC